MTMLAGDIRTLRIPEDAGDGGRAWSHAHGAADNSSIALIAETSAVAPPPSSRRTLYWVLLASFILHLSIAGLFLTGGFSGSGQVQPIGAEEGSPENLNVSVISEADLKRLSSDPYRQEAPPPQPSSEDAKPPVEAQPPTPPQAQEAPPKEAEPKEAEPKETKEAEAKPTQNKEVVTKEVERPDGLSAFAEKAAEQFSANVKRAFEAKETRQKTAQLSSSKNVKIFRPGGARTGKSDEFTREVVWALGATKPQGTGKWGTTIVTFLVSTNGQAEGLHIVKSSGDDRLDQGALMAVKQARLPKPPSGYPADDRTFLIEYISLPEG